MAERVGFEPTWLAPIRFRGGAVMTASVPLLIRRRSFYQQSAIIRKGKPGRPHKLNLKCSPKLDRFYKMKK